MNGLVHHTEGASRAQRLRRGAPLLGLLLLALALRLALWAQPLHELANDEVEYVTVARDLLAGRGWQFYTAYHWLRAPLYPLFLAGSLWLADGDLHRAALPNLALSVATVYLVYRLALELTGVRGRALFAGLLAALLFTFATFAGLYMAETLFSFLFTAALLLLVQWGRTAPAAGPSAPRRHWRLALAGLCFGLAALTRSLPVAFLPVVLLWIWLAAKGAAPLHALIRRPAAFVPPLLFALCVALTIAPWTLRNCRAYGECILIETGLSYNLWAFSEPREDMQTIFRVLEQIPNPADRAAEATRRGLERLREDPAILARKLWPNWIYLWRVKPIQDRFLLANYYTDPPPLVFLGALLLDDALYAAILVAAVFGVRRALAGGGARRDAALLLALWGAYVVATTLLTHGEARYRHFFFPALMAFAALAPPNRWRRVSVPAPAWLGSAALAGLLLFTIAAHYPWAWAGGGAARSWFQMAGDRALARGDAAAAKDAYIRAIAAQPSPDNWLRLGAIYRAQGDLRQAEFAYRAAWSLTPPYVAASSRLGDLLRAMGRDTEARIAFAGRYLPEQAAIDWSWTHLEAAPPARIDVGAGLDFGFVSGVYPAEEQQGATARWTDGRGRARLAAPPGDTVRLRLRLAAPHPAGANVAAQVCIDGRCQPVELAPTWRVISLQSTPGAIIEVRSPTFTAPDGRQLGVLVDWVEVVASGGAAERATPQGRQAPGRLH